MAGIPVVDLFAGAGGLGVGASLAGCDVRLSVEFDPTACETLRLNRRSKRHRVLQTDVCDLTGRSLREAAGMSANDPFVLVGGPPCQPFSKAAYWTDPGEEAAYRRARASGLSASKPTSTPEARPDQRRSLVQEFIRLAVEGQADGFLFENVLSLGHPRNVAILEGLLAEAKAAGYWITVTRANAAAYGVPQRRERLIVLGFRGRVIHASEPTHYTDPDAAELFRRPPMTAGEAISRFSGPEFFEPEEVVTGRWAEHLRTVPPGWNYKAHTAWGGHASPSFVTETRFWNFLLKLRPDRPSWTLAANPGPWIGPFHWESRRLRTPELAALQGFPEGYRFAGSRRDRVRQIGNAVPPPLAAAMIAPLVEALSQSSPAKRRRAAAP